MMFMPFVIFALFVKKVPKLRFCFKCKTEPNLKEAIWTTAFDPEDPITLGKLL